MNWICKKCQSVIEYKNYHTKTECKNCYNLRMKEYRKTSNYKKYMSEYQTTKRWLNGSDNEPIIIFKSVKK
jgi:hypothetical protein